MLTLTLTQFKNLYTYRPAMNDYKSLGVWIEIALFNGVPLARNYVT